jgi:hypothetical protein
MTISLKHAFESAVPDGDDSSLVRPSNWNAEHILLVATGILLGRVTAGDGVVEELTPTQVRTLLNVEDGAAADMSAAEILAALLTVDGTGSALDADLLDGNEADAFQPAAANLDTWAGLTPSADFQTLVPQTFAQMRGSLELEAGTDFYSIAGANAAFEPIDADILKADVGDTLTAGFLSDSYSGGTISSGTYTPAPATGQENFQHIVNGGAFTLAPPANNCCIILQITNNASAGAITTSGFTGVFGDAFTTTDGDDFICTIIKINGFSSLTVQDVS